MKLGKMMSYLYTLSKWRIFFLWNNTKMHILLIISFFFSLEKRSTGLKVFIDHMSTNIWCRASAGNTRNKNKLIVALRAFSHNELSYTNEFIYRRLHEHNQDESWLVSFHSVGNRNFDWRAGAKPANRVYRLGFRWSLLRRKWKIAVMCSLCLVWLLQSNTINHMPFCILSSR